MACNNTWVCFDCRRSVRRDSSSYSVPRCPSCRRPCDAVGYKTAIPAYSNIEGWKQLKDDLTEWIRGRKQLYLVTDVRWTCRQLEERLAELKTGPDTYKCRRQIKALQQKLAAIKRQNAELLRADRRRIAKLDEYTKIKRNKKKAT